MLGDVGEHAEGGRGSSSEKGIGKCFIYTCVLCPRESEIGSMSGRRYRRKVNRAKHHTEDRRHELLFMGRETRWGARCAGLEASLYLSIAKKFNPPLCTVFPQQDELVDLLCGLRSFCNCFPAPVY